VRNIPRVEALEKILSAAYEKAPKKFAFLEDMGKVSGVLTSHESGEFCRGYVQALEANNLPSDDLVLVQLWGPGNTERTFLVRDQASFQKALEEARDRPVRSLPTPRKVLLRMVVERMYYILKATDEHNRGVDREEAEIKAAGGRRHFSGRKKYPRPILSSREAYVGWTKLSYNEAADLGTRRQKAVEELRDRDDVPADIFPEAWDLIQVRDVMDS
jgi:hypothetical protein